MASSIEDNQNLTPCDDADQFPSYTVEVEFAETFKMPKFFYTSTLGTSCGRGMMNKYGCVFNWLMELTYYTLTIFLGVFIGLAWSLVFGTAVFITVWVMQPWLKVILIVIKPSIQIIASVGGLFGQHSPYAKPKGYVAL